MPTHNRHTGPSDDDLPDVLAAIAGDSDAFAHLYQRWFERVHDLAYRIVRDAEVAADVAQDTFVRAYRSIDGLADPAAFGGWLLRIARNRAYDVVEREQRARAADHEQLANIERAAGGSMIAPTGFAVEDRLARSTRPAEAAEDAELVALVWDAAEALGPRDREVLDLQLRHGLEAAEVGAVIGINRNAANQTVHRARQRLGTAVAARVLWRGGKPQCERLRDELATVGVDRFGAPVLKIVDRHVPDCDDCQKRRRIRLDPGVLFSAMPMLSIPALQARVTEALSADGVPVESHDPSAVATRVPTGRRRRATTTLVVVGLMIVAAVIVGIVVVSAVEDETKDASPVTGAIDHATVTAVATSALNASTSPTIPIMTATTIGLAADTSVDPRGATGTTAAVVVTPTSTPQPPSTTPPSTAPPLPSGRLSISRSTVPFPGGYSMSSAAAPRLTWSTSNVATVTLSGPNLTKHALDGEVAVCPGVESSGHCTLTPSIGTVTYRLRGYDGENALVLDRTVTLTVTT
jgi:RNA polymerase sigma factor (sigma-70 family)